MLQLNCVAMSGSIWCSTLPSTQASSVVGWHNPRLLLNVKTRASFILIGFLFLSLSGRDQWQKNVFPFPLGMTSSKKWILTNSPDKFDCFFSFCSLFVHVIFKMWNEDIVNFNCIGQKKIKYSFHTTQF